MWQLQSYQHHENTHSIFLVVGIKVFWKIIARKEHLWADERHVLKSNYGELQHYVLLKRIGRERYQCETFSHHFEIWRREAVVSVVWDSQYFEIWTRKAVVSVQRVSHYFKILTRVESFVQKSPEKKHASDDSHLTFRPLSATIFLTFSHISHCDVLALAFFNELIALVEHGIWQAKIEHRNSKPYSVVKMYSVDCHCIWSSLINWYFLLYHINYNCRT